ncbi:MULTISPECIES: DNA-binding protein [Nonomuraea]|uniref:DNA-binding protein n=1 Tax=Nonomuraea mangrovi TaxID=2316207 RepID=A0ABW4T176_9ACTN
MRMSPAEELLRAGAVLPPGTEGAGERAVPLTARTYRHPGLDGRVVVRLVAAELGAAEDLAASFLGLSPDREPEVVGLGSRRSLGFPEWVLVHHPEDGHHALAVVPELERTARQAKSKPKAALDAYQELAGRLAASVPHFLPTFYEQAGRVFLEVENATYAAQLFGHARKAEAQHGLAVDEDRLDAVFLEFALAGALPVKVLSGYARELAARLPADEALRRFARLCVRRTAGGLPPSTQMATDLRRLAKAAGADADAEEQAFLARLLGLSATLLAPTGWWKAHRPAITALALRDPETRGKLLNVMPQAGDHDLPGLWLDILEGSGATVGLAGGEVPEQERPGDGTAGWLERFLKARDEAWGVPPRLPALYALVERVADVVRSELAASGGALTVEYDVDLLDLLLALDIPVADSAASGSLRLEEWARGEGQRDLLALAADARYHRAFHYAADRFCDDEDGRRAVRLLAGSPGGRPLLAEWVRKVAARSSAAGLPDLPGAMRQLAWLPGEALALAEEEVRAAAGADVAEVLARTLRAGLFDELGWPAWDEAAAALVPKKDIDDLVVADAWPYLVVGGSAQVRVLGAEGAVLTHDLRVPADDTWSDLGFHHVDGELLVYWQSRALDGGLRGYWHNAPDRPRPMEGGSGPRGTRMDWYRGDDPVTLPVPGGGRTTGHTLLHKGDTAMPDERSVISDGTSFWVWTWEEDDRGGADWHEFDPVGGRRGRKARPGFLADALRSAPAGSAFHAGWVLPAPSDEVTPAAVPVDGVYGWRVVRLPDGSMRGEDLSGRTVTVGPDGGPPVRALTFPSDERHTAVVRPGSYQVALVDADGVVTATARTDAAPGAFAAGTLILPPVRYWHCLRPRDADGSAALRRVGRDTASALLDAGEAKENDLPARIRAVLPQVSDDALVAGIAGVVRFAAAQRTALRDVVTRLTEVLEGGHRETAPVGPTDELIDAALNGLGSFVPYYWHRQDTDGAHRHMHAIGAAVAEGAPAAPAGRTHLDLPGLPDSALHWDALLDHPAAAAVKAAAATTEEDHRTVLRGLLGDLHGLGLPVTAGQDRWRRMSLRLDNHHVRTAEGGLRAGTWLGLLPLAGGALLAFVRWTVDDAGGEWTALFHDPAGRFEVPAPYTVKSSSPVGGTGQAGWLEAFLAELDARGPAPWRPAAAEEFALLTGVSPTLARLVVSGMPYVDSHERSFLPKETRAALGVKVGDAAIAKDELREVSVTVRRAVVAALLPDDPARLWTDGPDVARAARIWIEAVGRRRPIPEWLAAEAGRALKTEWDSARALGMLLDPAAAPELTRDLVWTVSGDRVAATEGASAGFTGDALVVAVDTAGWLAHRLPAGDPIRAKLPETLAAVRARLAAPGLMLDLDRYVDLPAFRKAAGAPTEVTEGYERYGALVMPTYDDRPAPGIRVALLDAAGEDPYLRALLATEEPFPVDIALRTARDPRFEALLADPGDPVAGERDADGTWWPQDPTRSVPDLVVEVAKEHGLGEDAAALYLMLLAMPDPTDRHVARWTGWKPARLRSARAELAATDLVVEATRNRAGRSLFLPGGWRELRSPRLPLEQWKTPLFDVSENRNGPLVPAEPAAGLYGRAWRRVKDGDAPRFAELQVRRGKRR